MTKMKRSSYLLLLSIAFVVCGCGGGGSARVAEDTGSKSSKGGILDYTEPAIPKIEPVAEYRSFDGMAPVVTENTKRVVLPNYYTDYQFHEGMLAIQNRQTGKWGFMDTEGNIVIDFLWHAESPRFNHGVAVVGKSANVGVVQRIYTWYIIDKNGEVVKEFPKTSYVSQFTDGYAYVVQNNRFFYINTLGEPIFDSYRVGYTPLGFGGGFTLRPFSDGVVALYKPGDQRWGYADKQGNDVIEPVISDVGEFSEGLAPVRFPATDTEAPKWGFIDKEGYTAIAPVFTNRVSSFSEGYAIATLTNGKQVYIDGTGQVVSPEYNQAYPFKKGLALTYGYKNINVIDKDFNVLNTLEFDNILDAPRVMYHQDNYFTLHHYSGDLESDILYTLDGRRHSAIKGGSFFTGYKIWNFYGNLAHVTSGGSSNELDGFIDFNKGLEYVILLEKSKF
jgi:hypothetical protein